MCEVPKLKPIKLGIQLITEYDNRPNLAHLLQWQLRLFSPLSYLLLLLLLLVDPIEWNTGNVQKWLLWTEHLYRLPHAGKSFQELTGKDLCAMSEEEFRQRSPQCGDMLHAHLDIWKSGKGGVVVYKGSCPSHTLPNV